MRWGMPTWVMQVGSRWAWTDPVLQWTHKETEPMGSARIALCFRPKCYLICVHVTPAPPPALGPHPQDSALGETPPMSMPNQRSC